MTIMQLSDLIRHELKHGVYERGGRDFISFLEYYKDGDSVVLYLEEIDGVTYASDKGTTGYKVRVNGCGGRDSDLDIIRISIHPESAAEVCRSYIHLCQTLFSEGVKTK